MVLKPKWSMSPIIMRVMEYNVMSTPAVVVDGEVKIKGSVPTEADVRKALGL